MSVECELFGCCGHNLGSCPTVHVPHVWGPLSNQAGAPEAAKAALIEAAVKDARRKAEILAGAAGVKLGALLRMDYSLAEPRLETAPMAKAMLTRSNGAADSFAMDIHPEDIRAEDTVTLVWELL